jgi:hypothetical protein
MTAGKETFSVLDGRNLSLAGDIRHFFFPEKRSVETTTVLRAERSSDWGSVPAAFRPVLGPL